MSSHKIHQVVHSCKKLQGRIRVPGDKSMSHRALLFGALAKGETRILGLLDSADVRSTRKCLEAIGVEIQGDYADLSVGGLNKEFRKSAASLDCGNSGTTIRLMMGLLAGCPFRTRLEGDVSLSKRPMARVAQPLSLMGAEIEMTDGNFPPLSVCGGRLSALDYDLPHASAQVKSALLIASLFAQGVTRLGGRIESRDHTERMFRLFGLKLETTENKILFECGQELKGTTFRVPGDPSTASFWVAAAGLVPNSHLVLEGVSLNPTRTGFFEVAKRMGIDIQINLAEDRGEPVGDITLRGGELKGVNIDENEIPFLIDEIPILCILATQARGMTSIRGARELRFKESDRIEAVAKNLRSMGVALETFEDGLSIVGPQALVGSTIETYHDHRIAMSFAIAGLIA
ncbi:MAG: 3-phosphoshikimate 1-carboxyvinyltransferase, partial [Bdellovibrionales bacterium]|nr:3-phosphoshikimate 1-carboxyvinyltransferase [Bdellovibrionales bacterium]